MSRIVRLTERDLTRIVRRVIMEQEQAVTAFQTVFKASGSQWSTMNGDFVYNVGTGPTRYYSCSTGKFTDAGGQPIDQSLISGDAMTMKFIQQECKKA
jgi:hypothetical protein